MSKVETFKVFRNVVGQDANWVQVRLVGRGPAAGGGNTSAIGARVRVKAGGRTLTQEVSGGYGHTTTQNDLVLTFGLGAACAVDEIEVRWPDGKATTTRYPDIRANYRVELREGDARPFYVW